MPRKYKTRSYLDLILIVLKKNRRPQGITASSIVNSIRLMIAPIKITNKIDQEIRHELKLAVDRNVLAYQPCQYKYMFREEFVGRQPSKYNLGICNKKYVSTRKPNDTVKKLRTRGGQSVNTIVGSKVSCKPKRNMSWKSNCNGLVLCRDSCEILRKQKRKKALVSSKQSSKVQKLNVVDSSTSQTLSSKQTERRTEINSDVTEGSDDSCEPKESTRLKSKSSASCNGLTLCRNSYEIFRKPKTRKAKVSPKKSFKLQNGNVVDSSARQTDNRQEITSEITKGLDSETELPKIQNSNVSTCIPCCSPTLQQSKSKRSVKLECQPENSFENELASVVNLHGAIVPSFSNGSSKICKRRRYSDVHGVTERDYPSFNFFKSITITDTSLPDEKPNIDIDVQFMSVGDTNDRCMIDSKELHSTVIPCAGDNQCYTNKSHMIISNCKRKESGFEIVCTIVATVLAIFCCCMDSFVFKNLLNI